MFVRVLINHNSIRFHAARKKIVKQKRKRGCFVTSRYSLYTAKKNSVNKVTEIT